MSCAECGDTGVVELAGECPSCCGLQCVYENGIGRECGRCDGVGWLEVTAVCDCDVAAQARALHRRTA